MKIHCVMNHMVSVNLKLVMITLIHLKKVRMKEINIAKRFCEADEEKDQCKGLYDLDKCKKKTL